GELAHTKEESVQRRGARVGKGRGNGEGARWTARHRGRIKGGLQAGSQRHQIIDGGEEFKGADIAGAGAIAVAIDRAGFAALVGGDGSSGGVRTVGAARING